MSDFVVRKAESQFAYSNYRRYYQEARCHAGGEKKDAVKKLREYFSQHPYRAVKSIDASQAIQMASLLGKDGRFSDLNSTQRSSLNVRMLINKAMRIQRMTVSEFLLPVH